MARDWRTAMLAAFAAALLACACAVDAYSQSEAQGEAEETDDGAPPKAGARKRQDPAEAERSVEAALKQLHAGRAEQAVQSLSTTLAAGNLPPAIMAKALHVRGMAHRQQGRPAQAISDLTSALWLKGGLGGDDRDEAVRERSAAYADAGLKDPGDMAAEPASKTASSGNWFNNLLGGGSTFGSSSASPPPPSPRPPPRPAAPAATGSAAISEAWSSETTPRAPTRTTAAAEVPPATRAQPSRTKPAPAETTSARVPPPAPSRPAPAPAPEPAGAADGRYLVQLAAVRTEAEAQALAAKAKRAHASLLAGRKQTVDRAVFGNMGAYYRARFGPFASAQETQTVCAKLQGSGIDCLPVTR